MVPSTDSSYSRSQRPRGGRALRLASGRGTTNPMEGSTVSHQILVFADTESRASRTARPLRSRGCRVRTCNTPRAVLDLLEQSHFDLLVVERDDDKTAALELLRNARAHGFDTPIVLVTVFQPAVLAAAVNEGRVARVVRSDQALDDIVGEVFAALDTAEAEPAQSKLLRARCARLEDKIDKLVRDSIQREGAAQLLHDLLVEIGHAGNVKEVAGRCLARVVTMLRIDMAFIVLLGDGPQRVFSFGCPRPILDPIRELPWGETQLDFGERPIGLGSLLPRAAADRMHRHLTVDGVSEPVMFPLRVRDTVIGFLGLGARGDRGLYRARWDQLEPVAKQIAIAIENSRLIDAAAGAEALARGVLRHLPSTVLVCDAAGQIARSFAGRQDPFAGAARPGARLAELLPAHETAVITSPIASVARGADPVFLRALRLRLAGSDRLLNVSVTALPGREVMVILDDVTQRESMEGDLRRARALTSSLFANAPAGVVFLRRAGEIVDINNTACQIFRRQRSELLGENLGQLYPELWLAATGDVERGDQVTFRVDASDHATVSFSSTRLGRRGRPAGILLQIQDMGELEALREELRRKDNLALMGQMVSFIAHEIRNPLFGVSSAAQVLAREVDTEESARLSGAMLSEIERLGNLLEELLVFGSKRGIEPVPGDPAVLCSEIAAIHRDALAAREIDLQLDLEPADPPVPFDAARLRQVVVNLVTNAIDATPSSGSIRIATQARDGVYVIEVANTGDPIEREDLERIFDLFYSTKSSGSGLGLPICYKIVQDHGGHIDVHSNVATGTRFSVVLPLPGETL